ncbi:tRNA-specific adenosine deaminase subunit TAD3 [Yarrowia sp. B02]|nr:tRNA-specific adenosine deaminase subunit TAD3 [Yarrowia sp. B02]
MSEFVQKLKSNPRNNVIDDCFWQIKYQDDHRGLELIPLLTTTIPANKSGVVVKLIKDHVDEDAHDLGHLRRIAKEADLAKERGEEEPAEKKPANEVFLRVIIASKDTEIEFEAIKNGITEILGYEPPFHTDYASKYLPFTKQESVEWSKNAWPIMWRGNTAAIQTKLSESEFSEMKQKLQEVISLSKTNAGTGELPVATVIVDPKTGEVLSRKLDTRKQQGNPLNHCTMEAIAEIASQELARRQERGTSKQEKERLVGEGQNGAEGDDEDDRLYLCLDMHVYTTHEPCPMCSMALNHSRVGRLVYVESSPGSGGIEPNSGGSHGIHWNPQLNWKYEVWKWVGEDLDVEKVDESVNA